MRFRSWTFGVRTLTAAMAAIVSLGAGGCGKTPAPEEAVKTVAAPAAGSPIKNQKAEAPHVNPAAAADAALMAAVKAALAADTRLKSFAIDIRASNGAVELFGTVDAKSSQTKAEKLAASVAGVKSVKNHLVVVSGS